MIHKRNTEGMVTFVKNKHDDLIARTESAILSFEKTHERCDFKKIANVAGVSLAWLYRQKMLKVRIYKLMGEDKSNTNITKKASYTLKNRIIELEIINSFLVSENNQLKQSQK